MNRNFALSGLLLTSLTWTGVSSAEPIVQGLALGVERAFGFSTATVSQELGGVTNTVSLTGFSLGASRGTFSSSSYSTPRAAVDYILPIGLSFGAALGLATYSFDTDTGVGDTGVGTTNNSATALILAPRVGYMVGFNQRFGVWPRAGFTHLSQSIEGENFDTSSSFSALTFEAPLLFTPNKSFGFMATPALDLGVGGSGESNGQESNVDATMTEFSFTLGLFVAF